MGKRSLIVILLAACGGAEPSVKLDRPASVPDRVAFDFEQAVKASRDAYVELFDFAAVGEFEILLHRYDLNGRRQHLAAEWAERFKAEDGTPYPAPRERRNVGNFYTFLAQRTVGSGGCTAGPARSHYGKLLGMPFDPLPEGTPPGYAKLRDDANAWLAKGGVIGLHCTGGKGNLAIVYTQRDNARGYDLITIYDD
jgi:hypothetical protein